MCLFFFKADLRQKERNYDIAQKEITDLEKQVTNFELLWVAISGYLGITGVYFSLVIGYIDVR